MKDLELLVPKFLHRRLQPHEEYLRKYFPNDDQERLIIYFLTFPMPSGEFLPYYHQFIDHTGLHCSERWVYKMLSRLKLLTERLAQAEEERDHETVAAIRSGLWRAQGPVKTPSRVGVGSGRRGRRREG
jgi:hypothetical protein